MYIYVHIYTYTPIYRYVHMCIYIYSYMIGGPFFAGVLLFGFWYICSEWHIHRRYIMIQVSLHIKQQGNQTVPHDVTRYCWARGADSAFCIFYLYILYILYYMYIA